ncbi:hypothetical protein [Rodentibacter pneumotropicus]|uniref:Uncharacterized protein n=1 Tax=Rodentibacter pneumotropicus TaxID=758 RepID=A0A4V3ST31_9PAST|nr:hypothetical protein [Rodentibacter pneumotropicus]THA04373.1 hypothetical protein D3M77_10915 [Rodentibacter pneumotropicus]THA17376.1 hypothetical protein D3M76_01665 [Rodentibacter pneumotropicus]
MAKKSIHLTALTAQYIIDRTQQGERANYSAHINSAFSQLAHIAQAEKPTLTSDEWIELYNVYAGSDLTKLSLPLNLASDLLTHYGATVPKQLNITAAVLADKLVDMTQAQQFAIIDAVRVFWASGEDGN